MKLKLTNPTLDQIDAAVAEHVAGWKLEMFMTNPPKPTGAGIPPGGIAKDIAPIPRFTRSADAVLPLLEKWEYVDVNRDKDFERGPWGVAISSKRDVAQLFIGSGSTMAIAACIALLRAHGVEVEFTQ